MNIVVSTGPAQVSVPNVVGDTQAAATTAITGAGLILGTVTTSSSSTVASGKVISESPAAATSVNVGSAVNIVVSTGPATGPVPTAITLNLSQDLITAAASITFTTLVTDSGGNPLSITPTCSLTPDPTTGTGTLPTIGAGTIQTASDTRGIYGVTCTITSTTLSSSDTFLVLPPNVSSTGASNTQQNLASTFSTAAYSSSSILHQIDTALTAGNTSNVNTLLAQLQAGLNGVDFDGLQRSTPFAPEGGFPVDPSLLSSFGINPTAQDANVPTFLANLSAAITNLTTFLQTHTLATLSTSDQATFKTLEQTLAPLVTQLATLNPSAYGVQANADQWNLLLSTTLPQYYQALTTSTIALMTANGFTASLAPHKRLRAHP